MFHVISEFGLSETGEVFRSQIRTLEFVADMRFYNEDRIGDILPLCSGLKEMHYYVLFTCLPAVRVQDQAFGTVETIGLHAKRNPSWTPADLGGHLNNHVEFVTGPIFPNLRTLVLYGDWDGLIAGIPLLEPSILSSRIKVIRIP